MIRTLFLLLIIALGGSLARASDLISAPTDGASPVVKQPRETAQLIPEMTLVESGKPFDVILHLHSDPDWHTYWINPGDAGLATTIKWTLPDGFTAGPIQWPTPEKHDMGGLMTYGYAGDVYLLTTITPPATTTANMSKIEIKAHAEWLVCQEECIPGHADLTVALSFVDKNAPLGVSAIENKELFTAARGRLPVPNTRWDVKAGYAKSGSIFEIALDEKSTSASPVGHLLFFPEQSNVLSAQPKDTEQQSVTASDRRAAVSKVFGFFGSPSKTDVQNPQAGESRQPAITLLVIKPQQNGEKPDKLSGVLVSDQPLIGNAKAVYIPEFPVVEVPAAGPGVAAAQSTGEPPLGTGTPAPAATTETPSGGSTVAPSAAATTETPSYGRTFARSATATLIAVLGAAFIGGLILNLMPCVLPVLSLKVFSLVRHAGENPKAAWIQGAAFTAGVVISFWILAGILIFLQAAGRHIGWGFQMQNPGFVLALIFLFFVLALNLFGVFELGTSLVGLDAKATNQFGGLASSFGNGALATLAATPCTAPFMGSALGFASQQSSFISLLVFTFLALGMATPYLLLTIFPGALRFVPKPGAWMEAFKQFMGFLLMATVIYLVYVFGALAGQEQLPVLLFLLLLTGLAGWIYGRWGMLRTGLYALAVVVCYCAGEVGLFSGELRSVNAIALPLSFQKPAVGAPDKGWEAWTPAAVDQSLAQNRPVFVDFTAAWCLSCKVNERLALDTDAVKSAFAQKNVALYRADWTHADPAISETLQHYQRDGVPLYLLYSPKDKNSPQVLPEVLTPGIVLGALDRI